MTVVYLRPERGIGMTKRLQGMGLLSPFFFLFSFFLHFLKNWTELIYLNRNLDICMMVAMNAKEREEGDWESLFIKADPRFKFLGVKRPAGSRMCIIEAEWEGDEKF